MSPLLCPIVAAAGVYGFLITCVFPSTYVVCLGPFGRGQKKGMTRSFTCNHSMWRTCYWHWAFNRAPAGPLNLRGSPWEQHRRAEEFSRVNVQPLLISAEKSHSLNSSPTFPAVERLWMVLQKKVNTLPCLLSFFFPPFLEKHCREKAELRGY